MPIWMHTGCERHSCNTSSWCLSECTLAVKDTVAIPAADVYLKAHWLWKAQLQYQQLMPIWKQTGCERSSCNTSSWCLSECKLAVKYTLAIPTVGAYLNAHWLWKMQLQYQLLMPIWMHSSYERCSCSTSSWCLSECTLAVKDTIAIPAVNAYLNAHWLWKTQL